MTVAHRAPALTAEDVGEAVVAVRESGLRLTAARRLVIEALYASEDPVSAEEIAAGLEGKLPESDIGSVYRNLDRLEEIGLVRHVHLGHGPGRYTIAGRRESTFVVCERCGRHEVIDPADLAAISKAVQKRIGFKARFEHFPIVGLCPECIDAAPEHEHTHSHAHGHSHSHETGGE